jgi:hypothetical protein
VFGIVYIHKLLRAGPQGRLVAPVDSAATRRPMSIVDEPLFAARALDCSVRHAFPKRSEVGNTGWSSIGYPP